MTNKFITYWNGTSFNPPIEVTQYNSKITDYDSRELLEAATGSLASGYYSVTSSNPDILTYWNSDSMTFDPPLELWGNGYIAYNYDTAIQLLSAASTGLDTGFYSVFANDPYQIITYWNSGSGSFDPPLSLWDVNYFDYITSLNLDTECATCLLHDETTGTTAADATVNGNSGSYISGPTLAQDSLANGYKYSFLGPGYVELPYTIADPAVDDITIRFDFKTNTIAANTALFGRLNSQRCEVYLIPGGQIRFDLYDTTNLARITSSTGYDDNNPHSLVARLDQTSQLIEMWIDGASVGSASFSALSLTSGSTTNFRFNNCYSVASPGNTYFGGSTIFTSSLSDANCVKLSRGMI